MINYTTKFFNLKILRIKDIILHETTETSRLRNIFDRISNSKYLMNPVIIGKYNNHLMLIDGANRLGTLKELGCKLIIAQIIDYRKKKIKLLNWNHLIYGLDIKDIIIFCKKSGFPFKEISYTQGHKILLSSKNKLLISDTNKAISYIISLNKSLISTLIDLNKFTKFYFGKYDFDRSEEEIKYKDLLKYSRNKGLLVEFPHFSKEQIIKIANSPVKLPAGISRHILENRVLHIRYDILKLLNDKDILLKNIELEKYLLSKIDNNKVRQYRESVIVFDE